ncbi:MAG: 1-acyl-sn-glycerol-3-phosphate acyltransferase [Frankiaceae bacterium]|nr:1-acyl-sn-glycerol-3-phosphate acyltransferase [Frankiaceae bacterium]
MSLPRTARRLLTIPPVVALHVTFVLTAPITTAVAALLSLALRSTRPIRSVVLVVTYSALELVTLVRIAALRRGNADERAWQELMRGVVGSGEATLRRVLGIRTEIEEGSAPIDAVNAADGLVVLARHAGPGDTLLVAWLLVIHYGLRLEIVLKRLLRVIPAVDLAGDELPFCFVGARRGKARDGIAKLAAGLRRGDALLLFPEGGNFSHKRWRRGFEALARSGAFERVRRLRRNRHTLPPHAGGVVAAVTSAPHASVLLVAHSGLGPAGRSRPWWRLPLRHRVTIRTLLVPAADVPRDADAVPPWLDEMWTRVDTWVDGHAALRDAAPR